MADRRRRQWAAQVLLLRKPRGSDLDDGARYLWIDEGKTQCARRHLEVPSVLSSMLLRLAQGRHPNELLFGISDGNGDSRPHSV